MGDAVAPSVLTLGPTGVRPAPVAEAGAAMGTDMTALARRVTALEARLAVLEGRAEEVAHFTAKAALPNISVAGNFTLKLTDLVPERAGDVLRKGEQVDVRPPADLPAGVTMGIPLASADGVVSVPMKATAAVTAGVPIAWSITVLR